MIERTATAPAIPTTSDADAIPYSFQTAEVLTVAGAHCVHDVFSSFLPTLLPLLIEQLSLSLTMAGSLSAFMQAPAVLNPLIGYIADKKNVRMFIILAPAASATLMTIAGFMPSYATLALLLFTLGISIAAFHAPAPAMIARVSGGQVGRGMSYFMAGGELARAVAPLLTVWAVSMWTLQGIWRVAVLGWAASIVLYFRLKDIPVRAGERPDLRAALPRFRRVFLPLGGVLLFRSLLMVSLSLYLPTFMSQRGLSLWAAGGALSIWELAGVVGALISGPVSDLAGRRTILASGLGVAALLTLPFLRVEGWLVVPILLGMGLTLLSTQPVMLALVQDHLPDHRAAGNGLFMALSFVVMTLATLTIGALGDRFGLQMAFAVGGVSALLAVPLALWLPRASLAEQPTDA